jgi:SAM-dependent methyltransferase
MTQPDRSSEKYIQFSERLLRELDSPLAPGSKVFDLGSGSGKLVKAFRDNGYDCLGADLYGDQGIDKNHEHLSNIESLVPYILPFDNDEFDYALSQNVFEHVQDYDTTFSELARILKPGAFSLHMFPTRYYPIEEHVFVPGASIFRSYAYLYSWSWFSKLNPKWRRTERIQLSWSDTAHRNKEFLDIAVNYLTGDEILDYAQRHFTSATFIDHYFFKLWPGKISKMNKLTQLFPFLLKLHSTFRMRILLVKK